MKCARIPLIAMTALVVSACSERVHDEALVVFDSGPAVVPESVKAPRQADRTRYRLSVPDCYFVEDENGRLYQYGRQCRVATDTGRF